MTLEEHIANIDNEIDGEMKRVAAEMPAARAETMLPLVDRVFRSYLKVLTEARLNKRDPVMMMESVSSVCANMLLEITLHMVNRDDRDAVVDGAQAMINAVASYIDSNIQHNFKPQLVPSNAN